MPYVLILLVNLLLLGVGLATILIKRSMIFIVIGIELIIQAAISNYILFNSQHPNHLEGQVLAIFTTAISICEIVMVLAIALLLYLQYKMTHVDELP